MKWEKALITISVLAEQARGGRCPGVSAQDCHIRRGCAGWLQQTAARSPFLHHGAHWWIWNGVGNKVLPSLLLLLLLLLILVCVSSFPPKSLWSLISKMSSFINYKDCVASNEMRRLLYYILEVASANLCCKFGMVDYSGVMSKLSSSVAVHHSPIRVI